MRIDISDIVVLRLKVFVSGMDTLLTQNISKSSAMQRTGRAGREVRHFPQTLDDGYANDVVNDKGTWRLLSTLHRKRLRQAAGCICTRNYAM